jgi:hypothetical protein
MMGRRKTTTPAEDQMGRTVLVVDDDKKIVDLVSL